MILFKFLLVAIPLVELVLSAPPPPAALARVNGLAHSLSLTLTSATLSKQGAQELLHNESPVISTSRSISSLSNDLSTTWKDIGDLPSRPISNNVAMGDVKSVFEEYPVHLVADEMLDHTFPKYLQAINVLGQGAYGRTFLVKDVRDPAETLFVIKAFGVKKNSIGFHSSEEMIKRDWRMIDNPAVDLSYGEGLIKTRSGKLFLPMKYVAGDKWNVKQGWMGWVASLWSGKRFFTQDENVEIVQKVTALMQKLHKAQIVHNDVAPRNVIIKPGTLEPVLIDYGMAKYATKQQDYDLDFLMFSLKLPIEFHTIIESQVYIRDR